MQDTGDVLYRVSGAMMVMSGLWNGLLSLIYVGTLIWVCVGVFWFIPMVLALAEIVVGGIMIITGKQIRATAFAPLLGLAASLMNFNIFGSIIDIAAVGLGIGGFVTANQAALEDREFR